MSGCGRGALLSCGFWVTQTAHEKERECNNRAATVSSRGKESGMLRYLHIVQPSISSIKYRVNKKPLVLQFKDECALYAVLFFIHYLLSINTMVPRLGEDLDNESVPLDDLSSIQLQACRAYQVDVSTAESERVV
jgi:hypothetical protein